MAVETIPADQKGATPDVVATPAEEKAWWSDYFGSEDEYNQFVTGLEGIFNQYQTQQKAATIPAGDEAAWANFANYAKSLGLDPEQLKNYQGALDPNFYRSLLPEGMSQADMIREDLIMDPSYQFRFGEGQRAIERRQNAMGNRFSGGGLAELTRYGQDYASQEYSNAYNRLSGVAGTGQTVGSNLNQLGMNYGSNMGNIMTNMGTNLGNAALYQGMMGGRGISAGGYPAYNQWQQLGNINWNNIFGG